MTDFPAQQYWQPKSGVGSAAVNSCVLADIMQPQANNYSTSAVWPAANRALYIPIQIYSFVTVTQISFQVATQSGNFDVGIYDEQAVRIVSKGSTGVGAAGIQVVDITDTALSPGTYFLAMNVDNTTASFLRASFTTGAEMMRSCGVQQQAVGAVTLPSTATFANPASNYFPLLMAHFQATV